MKTIGITGGVGAGKSFILNYIKEHYNAKVYLADDVANELKLPGHQCYEDIVNFLGQKVLDEDGYIDKYKMAEMIFSDDELLQGVNQIIHPAVRSFILDEIDNERNKGEIDYFILEAALLIEEKYDLILDELWYVYTKKEIRVKRLKETRNYSDEKIQSIMATQLSDEEFRSACKFVIDNNYDQEKVFSQIDRYLEEM